jgi:hypothetical protein
MWDNCDPSLERKHGSLDQVVKALEDEYEQGHDYTIHVFDDFMNMVAAMWWNWNDGELEVKIL